MLALTFGTLALTGYLYVVIPKGFLPRQDTGLLTVVLQGAPDVSFLEMSRLQSAVSSIISKDKDVAGVVAVIGVGTLNATPNVGHLAVTLTPRDDRSDTADVIGERLREGSLGGRRRHALRRAGPGHPDHDACQPLAISIHLDRHRCRRDRQMGRAARRSPALGRNLPQHRARDAGRRASHLHRHRPRDDGKARALRAEHRRHAERRLRPAADLDDLRAIEPIPRDPRGSPAISHRSDGAREALCRGLDQHGARDRAWRRVDADGHHGRQWRAASAACDHRQGAAHDRALVDRP